MSDEHKLVRVGEKLNWSFDWTTWLAGDTITSRQWSIDPTGPTLTNPTGGTVTVDGFTQGQVYRLQEDIVTAAGLSGKRTIVLRTE